MWIKFTAWDVKDSNIKVIGPALRKVKSLELYEQDMQGTICYTIYGGETSFLVGDSELIFHTENKEESLRVMASIESAIISGCRFFKMPDVE